MTDLDLEHLAALDREDAERCARLEHPRALADAAAWYASVGWPIFPLTPGGKTPITPRGFKDATADPAQIRAWWHATPQANIGAPTGHRFDVIDIDGPAGFASLADLRHKHCPPDCCAVDVCPGTWPFPPVLAKAYTGGGGRHILIAPQGWGNATAVLPGLDVRGLGGYVVLPPSVHESGRRYEWLTPPGVELLEVAA